MDNSVLRKFQYIVVLFLFILYRQFFCSPPELRTENIILVTLDGLRWEEIFFGLDPELVKEYTGDPQNIMSQYWDENLFKRRKNIFPFIWQVIGREGILFGNRTLGSNVNVSNKYLISYPGYNEILTGFSDDSIDSNGKVNNKNINVLEYISQFPRFKGRAAVFSSWDTFPYIINEERNGIPVNAGNEEVTGSKLDKQQILLNELQHQIPTLFNSLRYDAFTFYQAFEYLAANKPRLLYVALGETDEYGHLKDYAKYIEAANRADKFLRILWDWIQSDQNYKNKTTLIITTDHGRGKGKDWTEHGNKVTGSDQIWIAVIGPDTPAVGEKTGKSIIYQSQIAKTIAAFLKIEYNPPHTTGAVINDVFIPVK